MGPCDIFFSPVTIIETEEQSAIWTDDMFSHHMASQSLSRMLRIHNLYAYSNMYLTTVSTG